MFMKNKIVRIYVVLLGVVLASCLDDSQYALDPSGSQNIIEFLDPSVPVSPAGAIYPAWTTSLEVSPRADFEQVISYSGPNGNSKDIQVTLAVDPTALQAYNTQMTNELHGGTYELMPASNYSLTTLTATIPKGETKVSIPVTVFPDKFDLSKSYAIPLRIVSASSGNISAHFSVAILVVVVKNKYDGTYSITGGSITRNSATGPDLTLGGNYNSGLEMDLVTIDGTSVGITPLWKDGSGVGGVAGTSLTINPTTNQVTVKSSTNATLKNTPATVNSYDPATKTFTLSFDWGNAPNTRIVSGLTLKYVGPR